MRTEKIPISIPTELVAHSPKRSQQTGSKGNLLIHSIKFSSLNVTQKTTKYRTAKLATMIMTASVDSRQGLKRARLEQPFRLTDLGKTKVSTPSVTLPSSSLIYRKCRAPLILILLIFIPKSSKFLQLI